MKVGNKSIYDGQFWGNILVVGKTRLQDCVKTYVLQKLRLDKFFGKLVKIEWVTGIEIQSCFSNKVEFHLATELDDLVSSIEKFKLRTRYNK